MTALDQLAHVADLMDSRPQLIEEARQQGYTWEQIATALRMSRAGVIKLHNTR